jgi:predicted RecA/RadA family phage recombinase
MATTFVHAGRRRQVVSAQLHKAGDLVYYDGWFGVVQDDVKTVGDVLTIICEGVWDLRRGAIAAVGGQGVRLYAYPTAQATTLQLWASFASGALPIGRSWASIATATIKTQLFNPNAYLGASGI